MGVERALVERVDLAPGVERVGALGSKARATAPPIAPPAP